MRPTAGLHSITEKFVCGGIEPRFLCLRARPHLRTLSADTCPRTKSGNDRKLYADKLSVRGQLSVVCRLGWKTRDKVCRPGRVRVHPAHTYFLQCVSFLTEFELLTCGWTKEFLLLLRIYSPVPAYGMCTVLTIKTEIKRVIQLTFLGGGGGERNHK
jgi:hypothetical protein